MLDYAERLRKKDYEVQPISLETARTLVSAFHYAKGGSNTATYRHGLFKKPYFFELSCLGVAWWLPPTKAAALATYPANWQGVLSLSRLVIVPDTPKNACSFLLAASMKRIDRVRWPCLVTYADTWQGHVGTIYKATNWTYVGKTKPTAVWVRDGRVIARKAGARTRTKQEMLALGCVCKGRFSKHKFTHIVE
jgi:hypothetical protein